MKTAVLRKMAASFLLTAFCAAAVWGFRAWSAAQPPKVDPRLAARSKGDPRSKVWIIEYVDFQCETCAAASKGLSEFLKKHPDAFYLQTRYHPLVKKHQYALKSAIYADCAAEEGRFWPFQDLLFEKQPEWSMSPDADSKFAEYALAAGLDAQKMSACVSGPAAKDRVMKEKDESTELGVQATPTFFVNGKKLVGVDEIAKELKELFPEGGSS
jgi:protein-disulfide isomerase